MNHLSMLQAEIKALREQLSHTPGDHAEIMQKELAAHKEMVAELRAQLVEKDTELQVYTWTHHNHFSLCKKPFLIVQ